MNVRSLLCKTRVAACLALSFLTLGTHVVKASPLDVWYQGSISNQMLTGITRGRGNYLAVGYGGQIWMSPDAMTWTRKPFSNKAVFQDVKFGGDVFVAVGKDEKSAGIFVSSDGGNSWEKIFRAYAYFTSYYCATYSDSMFHALGDNSHVSYSFDGLSWDGVDLGGSGLTYTDVASGAGARVYVGNDYNNIGLILTSTAAGANWQLLSKTSTCPANVQALSGVTFGNGLFVVVGNQGTIWTSPDGFNWTSRNAGTTANLTSVVYANGFYMAVGSAGAVLTSPNGIDWSHRSLGAMELRSVTFAAKRYVTVGSGGFIGVCNYPAIHSVAALEQPAGNNLPFNTTVNFGSSAGQTTVPLTFTLRNNGNKRLKGIAFSFTGANTTDFTVAPATLPRIPVGGSRTFVVTFSPKSTGSRTAELRVKSSDPLTPYRIQLSGTGTP